MRPEEQRISARYPVSKEHQGCEIKVNAERIPGKLLDESMGGFAVLVKWPKEAASDAKPQSIEIKTYFGWFRAQIIHVSEVQPSAKDLADLTSATANFSGKETRWCRLGLRRVGQVAKTDTELAEVEAMEANMPSAMQPSSYFGRIFLGVNLALLIATILVVSFYLRR
jgi:hypothetical protein